MLSSSFDKAELFAENFSENYTIDDSGVFLADLHFRHILKQHSIIRLPSCLKKS